MSITDVAGQESLEGRDWHQEVSYGHVGECQELVQVEICLG